jgi:dTDP-4-amino-4,6-dideoxygalactose transaminase
MLALKAAHVGPGDTVAVPDMAFEAVAMTVLRVGAKPVVLDLDGRTWNLAESNLVLPRGRPPKAVIAVDNFGSPCDWQGIAAFCKREGVTFILDSCEALGASHAAGPPSSFADLVVYSFSYTKPIHAAGAGGALCARSELIDDVQRRPDCAAWSARLAELNAAHLVYAWPDLSRSVTRLNEIYGRYRAGLEPLGAVAPEVPVGSKATWMIAPFRFPKDAWDVRPAELISWLWQHRIEGRRAFPLQSERFSLGPSQKTSRALYDEIVCLPTGAGMPLEWVPRVIDCLAHAKQSRPAAPAVPLG